MKVPQFVCGSPLCFPLLEPDSLQLAVIEGPAIEGAPLTIPPRQAATIGRARDCHICLPDPTVSRQHCAIACRGGKWFIRDLESRHGTFLNSVRLDPLTPHPLDARDLLRLGPWTFRVSIAGREADLTSMTITSTIEESPLQRISRVEPRELAQHRLHLLLDAFARVSAARTEQELGDAVVNSALAATGFERAALIRHASDDGLIEVLQYLARDPRERAEQVQFSRSLLRAAAEGQLARLTSDGDVPLGVSIAQLGITSALCAPVMLGGIVAAYLYLDARGRDMPAHGDAAGFCEAIARLYGLSLANLKREELERRQRSLEADLSAAREAQQLIVPPTQRRLNGIAYAMQMCPGSFVAGDLFDIVVIDDTRTAVVIGDVTGEGIGSAILMASAQAHLHSALRMFPDPGIAVSEVNAYVSDRSAANKFISMWVGVFDSASGEVQLVDAGHGHWMIRRAGGEVERSPLPNGTLVGIDAGLSYRSRSIRIEPGDRIVLFSDGVIEQVGGNGEQFGHERVAEVLRTSPTVEEDVEMLFAAVREHGRCRDLADDATVASVTFAPARPDGDETV